MANACLHIDSKDRFSVLRQGVAYDTPTKYPQGENINFIGLNPSNPGSGATIVPGSLSGLVVGEVFVEDDAGNVQFIPQPKSNDFTIQAPQPLLYGYVKNIKVATCNMQYNVPTIIPSEQTDPITGTVRQTNRGNDKFKIWSIAGTGYVLTIPYGFYNPYELCAILQQQIRNAGNPLWNNFTVSYTAVDGYTLETNSINPAARFSLIAQPVIGFWNQAEIEQGLFDVVLHLYYMMGYRQANENPNQLQVMGRGTMLYTDYVDVCSTRLTKYQRQKDTDSDPKKNSAIVLRVYLNGSDPVVQQIPIEGQPNTYMTSLGSSPLRVYQHYNTTKTIRWSAEEAIYELDFQLRDMWGDLIYTIPGESTEFQLTLLCFENEKR